MDAVTLALAKKYTNSQRIAYVEYSEKTITWDGDTTNAEDIYGALAVKIFDDFVDLNKVSAIALKTIDGKIVVLPKAVLDIGTDGGIVFLSYPSDNNKLLLFSVPLELEAEAPTGVYVNASEDVYRVESLIYETETIHPIDPKFIPGAVLPVVELSTGLIGQSEPVALSEAESALLDEVAERKVPIIVIMTAPDGAKMSSLCIYASSGSTVIFNSYVLGGGGDSYLQISNATGAWTGKYGA